MQHVHWYIGEHLACCIDSQYWSAALCSRMQSSGPAWDSRREPSVSKFSSSLAKYCSSSHNQWPIYVTAPLAFSLPRSPLMERLHFLSPVPLWLNCSHSPAGLFWRAGHGLLQWSPSLSSVTCFNAGILSWCPQLRTSLYKNDTVRTFLYKTAEILLQPDWSSVKLWEGSDHAHDDLVKIPEASMPWIPYRNVWHLFLEGRLFECIVCYLLPVMWWACGWPRRGGWKETEMRGAGSSNIKGG